VLTAAELIVIVCSVGSVLTYLLFGERVENWLFWWRMRRRMRRVQRMLEKRKGDHGEA
jgi:hypothetical protein